ncbi:MAG: diaminopropionate ammonia-lyase [Acidiferrobacterales bacterium]
MKLLRNPRARPDLLYGTKQRRILDPASAQAALHEISSWPTYQETPLIALPGLATQMGVAQLNYKDESGRFGLGSFKGLGGAYAVYRCVAAAVAARTGAKNISASELLAGKYRELTAGITVCCATDGNHGKSVAWGAQIFGCSCVIYIHESVSKGREAAIARFGARVVRNPGTYDDAVRRVAEDAAANGWIVVSDTSYEGYTDIPRDVMHGYTVMIDEVMRVLSPEALPTHVFVQGGVGGLAAAVCARLWWEYEEQRPQFVVVEPERAAASYESAKAGQRVALNGDIDTVMACLSCGETSLLAWDILADGSDFFMTIPDSAAIEMMRLLATGANGDPPLVAGESAVAGIAGLLAVSTNPDAAQEMNLGPDSRVLVFGTEGDTDPELYRQIVGRTAEEVRATSRG